jgi:serine protease Do
MAKPLLQPLAAWLAVVAATSLILFMPPAGRAGQGGPGVADMIASVQPSVVNIAIVTHATAGPVQGNMASQPTAADHQEQSSGFFVAASGILVTNRHSIAGASEIFVTLHDATRLKACVITTAAQSDIALLRVNAGKPVPVVEFGDSDRLRPGDPVFVIGNPLDHGGTVTAGIVSALDRNTTDSGFGPFLQIDASVNHGSSGGPVFDAAGKVVGVATALYSPEGETGSVGLGLAIPANDAKFVVERLLASGRLRLGWIGAHVQPVSADLAAAVRLPSVTGSMITDVQDDSPAARAGLGDGDVILGIGGDDAAGPRTLNRMIAGATIGGVVKLGIWRDGAPLTIPVVIGEWPAAPAPAAPAPAAICEAATAGRRDLGLLLGPLTRDVRDRLGLSADQGGVLVTDVVANSVAADRGIVAGSVIVNVQRQAVASAADVQSGIDAARGAGRALVLLLVRDSRGLRWMALPLDQAAQSGPGGAGQ